MEHVKLTAALLAALSFGSLGSGARSAEAASIDDIQTIVVLYAENRSFDNLYGAFPGANGLPNGVITAQRDRDGTAMTTLPPIWGGLTGRGIVPPVVQAQTERLPNGPFAVDDPAGFNLSMAVTTRDLWHHFYQNQMQIDGGRNDRFVAYADSGALVMGHYDGSTLPMWDVAKRYTLADNFFMGGFGSSFFNHFYLICACAPYYPDANTSPAKPSISVVDPDGVTLTLAQNSPSSSVDGIPKFAADGNLTRDFYAVNTMQPPYQPSANKPAPEGDPAYADPANPTTLPPQDEVTIGDLLSGKNVSWAWYAGAWQATLDSHSANPEPNVNFQFHHAPFNYFVGFAPGTQARAEHLRDGGLDGSKFVEAIDSGTLPQVAFYKPQGNLNEHAGYTDVMSGDRHLADLVGHLERSPQWAHMVVIVTYDENGGWWDHVAPPKADRWGPGTRIPAIIISPFAKKGVVDHTVYDTASILRLITRRFRLPVLTGLKQRDAALVAHGGRPMGDLTAALDLTVR